MKRFMIKYLLGVVASVAMFSSCVVDREYDDHHTDIFENVVWNVAWEDFNRINDMLGMMIEYDDAIYNGGDIEAYKERHNITKIETHGNVHHLHLAPESGRNSTRYNTYYTISTNACSFMNGGKWYINRHGAWNCDAVITSLGEGNFSLDMRSLSYDRVTGEANLVVGYDAAGGFEEDGVVKYEGKIAIIDYACSESKPLYLSSYIRHITYNDKWEPLVGLIYVECRDTRYDSWDKVRVEYSKNLLFVHTDLLESE